MAVLGLWLPKGVLLVLVLSLTSAGTQYFLLLHPPCCLDHVAWSLFLETMVSRITAFHYDNMGGTMALLSGEANVLLRAKFLCWKDGHKADPLPSLLRSGVLCVICKYPQISLHC